MRIGDVIEVVVTEQYLRKKNDANEDFGNVNQEHAIITLAVILPSKPKNNNDFGGNNTP